MLSCLLKCFYPKTLWSSVNRQLEQIAFVEFVFCDRSLESITNLEKTRNQNHTIMSKIFDSKVCCCARISFQGQRCGSSIEDSKEKLTDQRLTGQLSFEPNFKAIKTHPSFTMRNFFHLAVVGGWRATCQWCNKKISRPEFFLAAAISPDHSWVVRIFRAVLGLPYLTWPDNSWPL